MNVTIVKPAYLISNYMVTVTETDPLPDEQSLSMYIPDFNGDEDVDLVDFGEFASYYLIGADW